MQGEPIHRHTGDVGGGVNILDLPAGSVVTLVLDLDHGGTLEVYVNTRRYGVIAEGLVGPLLPCIECFVEGKTIQIEGERTRVQAQPLQPLRTDSASTSSCNQARGSVGNADAHDQYAHDQQYLSRRSAESSTPIKGGGGGGGDTVAATAAPT